MSARVIQTASGLFVNPLRLRPDDIRIYDIAHALSQQCRFSGHTRVFYSVAEHSCRVASYVYVLTGNRHDALHGLLHDAAEAYLVDLPKPVKHNGILGLAYRRAERRAERAIAEAFSLPARRPAIIAEADARLLATERRDLMPPSDDGEHWGRWLPFVPLHATIEPWPPSEAERQFLDYFDDYQ